MTLLILFVFVALAFSFFCSIAEAVLLSLTPSYVATLEARNPKAGRRLAHLKENVDRPLSAILSLNTIAHTIGAAGAGAQAAIVFGEAWLGAASAVLTLLILVFSEIIPKTLGAVHWRRMAPSIGRMLEMLVTALKPFVWLSEIITRAIGGKKKTAVFDREEFTALADIGKREGELHADESQILRNLMRFSSENIRSIITPRPVVFMLPQEMTAAEFVAQHLNVPFSRIPLYAGDRDHVAGFVLRRDVLQTYVRGEGARPLQDLHRDIRAVPDNLALMHLFNLLMRERRHIALVQDEYGGFAGIVTLEDVIETLLGMEIVDEQDTSVDMQTLARQRWQRKAEQMGIALSDDGRILLPDSSAE